MRHVAHSGHFRRALAATLLGFFMANASPGAAQSPCTCRAAGTSFALDACTCLKTPEGPRIACCGKVLNNTAWRFTAQACPTARSPAVGALSRLAALAPPDRSAPASLTHTPWRPAMTAK